MTHGSNVANEALVAGYGKALEDRDYWQSMYHQKSADLLAAVNEANQVRDELAHARRQADLLRLRIKTAEDWHARIDLGSPVENAAAECGCGCGH